MLPDWDLVRRETVEHLQQLIRLDTVNPPGNEIRTARYIARVFGEAGIETQLYEPAPGRAVVVARIAGRGAARPVMLLAHMDTVGVEAAHWSVDPFGGEEREGYIYGRGAIDDKGMLAANVEAMLLLARRAAGGEMLSRDVVFVATSDEEAGGELGIVWLAAHHPELLRAELALNEGGRIRIVHGRPLYAGVQVAEKTAHLVRVIAHGPGGHAAIPLAGNAIGRLGRALTRITAHRERVCLLPTTRLFFEGLGAVWPETHTRRAMLDVASSDAQRVERGAKVLSRTPIFNAVLRTGISPTLVMAGIKSNVIPTTATATLNVRTLPGLNVDDVVERLRGAVRDPLVELEVVDRGDEAPSSDPGSPFFSAIAESARSLVPSLAVVPYLSTGATDNVVLRRHGVQAYGLLPFPMTEDDEDRMHGVDERVPLEALHFGVRLIHGALLRIGGAA